MRDYRKMVRGSDGVLVPRWMLYLGGALLALWFAARIFVPPMWVVQQLDAPEGDRSARLMRSVYLRHHFVVKVREGWFWQTAFYSPPLPEDLRLDLRERLQWSPDGQKVWLRVEDEPVWGFDFERQRNMTGAELAQVSRSNDLNAGER